MADSNLTISVSANTADLRASLAVAESAMRDFNRQLTAAARTARSAGDDLALTKLRDTAAQVERQTAVVAGLKAQMEGVTKAAGLNRAGLLELQAAGVNSFQALASGMDVFRVAMMEGSQVVGALVQGGVRLTSTFGLMAAGALVVTAGVGYLAYQAYQAKQNLTEMSSALLLTGRLGGTGLIDLDKMAAALADKFNLSKVAASGMLSEIAKAAPLNMQQVQAIAELAAAEAAVRKEDPSEVAKRMVASFREGAAGAIKMAQSYNIVTVEAERMLKSGNEAGALTRVIDQITQHIEQNGGAWAVAKARFDQYMQAIASTAVEGMAPNWNAFGPPPPTPTAIPSASGPATAAELALLAEIRHRESSGQYDRLHSTGQRVTSLAEVEAASGKSRAFGGYGFQPGTYRSMAAVTGLSDISPASQDRNALELLRRYGPNASISWEESGVKKGRPYDTTGLGGAANAPAEDKLRREQALRVETLDQQSRAVIHRHSLEQQLEDAKAHAVEISKLHGQDSNEVKQSVVQVGEAQARLYDADTALYIAGLRAKQAATQDWSEKIKLQGQIIDRTRTRGAGDAGGGIDKAGLAQLQTELASMQRQAGQEAIQMAEQRVQRQRQVDQLELQAFTATEQLKVARGQQTKEQALANEDTFWAGRLKIQQQRVEELLGNDRLTSQQRERLQDESNRIGVEMATRHVQSLTRQAEAAKAQMDSFISPIKSSISSGVQGLITGRTTPLQAASSVGEAALGSVLNKAGDKLFEKVITPAIQPLFDSIFGAAGDAAGAAALTGSAAALTGAASALTGAAAALSAGGAASGAGGVASGVGGAASAASGGGGIFGWIGSLFSGGAAAGAAAGGGLEAADIAVLALALSGGGVIPAAAGGWSLPKSFGSDSVLSALTPGEMVLPKHISEGIQGAIAGGGFGGGGDAHFHFHGPADAPAMDRWYKNLVARNPQAMRDVWRNNRLTPRSF